MIIALQILLALVFIACAVQVARNWGTPRGIAWSAGAVAASMAFLAMSGSS